MEKKSISITKKPGEEPKKVKKWDPVKYFLRKDQKQLVKNSYNRYE